ncbi:g4961 [Coccomyxa viridis]|uniref:G4961 protein n=1 Tax=Coccomyxa viridis TaxID=1274662 RepID=A0ABP1FRL9_9CHLO
MPASVGPLRAPPSVTFDQRVNYAQRSCAAALAAAALILIHPLTAAAQVVQAQPQGGHHNHSASPATVSAPSQAQAANAVASIAGLFGFQSPEDDGDTAGPFAVQGQTRKKYIIERKDGEKVVARKQGITTSTCLTARPLIGDQSSAAPSQTCKQAEAKTVDQACASSCQEACRSSISEFTEAREKFSGFVSQPQERDKITRACTRRCVYECKKPADGYVFEVNTRR